METTTNLNKQPVFEVETAKLYTPYGKNVLVTGATKGIGRATAIEMARLGAKVFVCARGEQELILLLGECEAEGLDVRGQVADVADEGGRKKLVSSLDAAFGGKLDVLINNVGTNIPRRETLVQTDDDFDFLLNTNLKSAFSLTRECHSMLQASEDACVILVSSIAGGPVAMKSGSLYAMTKASLNQLAKNLTCEWSKDGIRVLSVAPGYIETPLAMTVLKDEEYKKSVLDRVPMKRIGKPEEVARVMAFLSSPGASYMSGNTVHIDGGYSVMGLF
eukprot:jgi/Picsp_1/4193/NSC_01702-R1_tropine dehydrogenase